jgi:hypothetical protein
LVGGQYFYVDENVRDKVIPKATQQVEKFYENAGHQQF